MVRSPAAAQGRVAQQRFICGYDLVGDSNVIEIEVSLSRIRQALEAPGDSRPIHAVRPVGYILRAYTAAVLDVCVALTGQARELLRSRRQVSRFISPQFAEIDLGKFSDATFVFFGCDFDVRQLCVMSVE